VDLTLYDRNTGKPIDMVGGYDEFSDRSYPDYLGGTSRQRWHRDLLRRSMADEGFTAYEAQWLHYRFKEWEKYPLPNRLFEELKPYGGLPEAGARLFGEGLSELPPEQPTVVGPLAISNLDLGRLAPRTGPRRADEEAGARVEVAFGHEAHAGLRAVVQG